MLDEKRIERKDTTGYSPPFSLLHSMKRGLKVIPFTYYLLVAFYKLDEKRIESSFCIPKSNHFWSFKLDEKRIERLFFRTVACFGSNSMLDEKRIERVE